MSILKTVLVDIGHNKFNHGLEDLEVPIMKEIKSHIMETAPIGMASNFTRDGEKLYCDLNLKDGTVGTPTIAIDGYFHAGGRYDVTDKDNYRLKFVVISPSANINKEVISLENY